ncbi:MATE family efflux transporter [Amaricoccus tamworthensis]|uniref:MATE family efflux transporter n=1 Tax=Amaricoccus tamworthensis TaxID=57002 RepID=UPI003C7E4DEE
MAQGAKFLHGRTMRHVIEMTLTGATGLTFMFLVDAAALFWVSKLDDPTLLAALGFAWTIMFFAVGSSIGLAIAATALVSRGIGQGERANARRTASSALIISFAIQFTIAALMFTFRDALVGLAGATGETRTIAVRYLGFIMPSIPLIALGMVGSSILRALGDGWRSMSVTLAAGAIAVTLDPLFILYFGLGIDGAALVLVLSRTVTAALAIWYLVRVHKMLAPVRLSDITRIIPAFFAIALPGSLTQLSTPCGNMLLTWLVSRHGDGAVAGWIVVSRVSMLAFGGIFALSGAIGGIIGQNYGANLLDRVRSTYRDALIFVACYTCIAWCILFLTRHFVADMFQLSGDGLDVYLAFAGLAAGGFVFNGSLFCANAAFNTLGKPLWSTGFNWMRDALVMFPLAWALSSWIGGPGAVYGQSMAGVIVGAAAAMAGWRYVSGLERARPVQL